MWYPRIASLPGSNPWMASSCFRNVRRYGIGTIRVRYIFCISVLKFSSLCRTRTRSPILVSTVLTETNKNTSHCWTRKHVEYFPHEIEIRNSDVRALRLQLNWCRVGECFVSQRPRKLNWITDRGLGVGTICCGLNILDVRTNERNDCWASHCRYAPCFQFVSSSWWLSDRRTCEKRWSHGGARRRNLWYVSLIETGHFELISLHTGR